MDKINIDRIRQALLGNISSEEIDEIISYLNRVREENSYEVAGNILSSLEDSDINVLGNANILGNNNYLVYVEQSGAKVVTEALQELKLWMSKPGEVESGKALNDKLLTYVTNLTQNPEFSSWGQENYFPLQATPNKSVTNIDLHLAIREVGDRSISKYKFTYTIQEAIFEFKRMILIGQPGSGKTTTLKNLCLISAHEYQQQNSLTSENYLPVYIRLPNYNSVVGTTSYDRFLATIRDAFQRLQLDLREEEFRQILDRTNLLLLLDGLNEIGDSNTADFVDGLNTFISGHPNHLVIITSRAYNFQLGKQRLPVLEILELKYPEDIKKYLSRYLVDQFEILKIMDIFENNLRLRQLATNPLLLFLIVIIFKNQYVLPASRSLLLEKIAYGLLSNWETRSIQVNRFWSEDKHKLLQILGREMKVEGQELSTTRIIELMKYTLDMNTTFFSTKNKARPLEYEVVNTTNINMVLDELKENRILIGISNSDVIRFWHQTLQEYFAAAFMLSEIVSFAGDNSDSKINKAKLKKLIFDESWHEIISLACGLIASSEHRIIQNKDNVLYGMVDLIWPNNKVLASLCLSNIDNVSRQILYTEKLKKTVFLWGIYIPRAIPWVLSIFLVAIIWVFPEPYINIKFPVVFAPFVSILLGVIASLMFFRIYVLIIDYYEIFSYQNFIRPCIIALRYMQNKNAELVLSEFNTRTLHDFSVSDRAKSNMEASENLFKQSEEELIALLYEKDNQLQVIEILGEIGGQESLKALVLFLKNSDTEVVTQTFQSILHSLTQIVKRNNLSDENDVLAIALRTYVVDNRQDFAKRLLVHRSLISMGVNDVQSPNAGDVARIYLIRLIWIVLAIVMVALVIFLRR